MARVTITPEQFGQVLRDRMRRDAEKAKLAAYDALLRALAAAVAETKNQKLVDRGHYMNAWAVSSVGLDNRGYQLHNDAPYAGVIEYGRRPGRPGPPLDPILEWVERKLVGTGAVDPEDAYEVAEAIRWKLHVMGSIPHGVLAWATRDLKGWFGQALRRRLRR